ncbi:MAG: ATP-binding protein [Pyrinomonadaceae bacterium]
MIELTAVEADGNILLSVRDNGPGSRPSSDVGVGISNTRARLRTLFGEAGELQILNGEGGGTVATVHFPLRMSDG